MNHPEQSVLAAIAELEAEENPDDITELVRAPEVQFPRPLTTSPGLVGPAKWAHFRLLTR